MERITDLLQCKLHSFGKDIFRDEEDLELVFFDEIVEILDRAPFNGTWISIIRN